MSLAEWDEKIAPHLHAIENGAEMAARHVGHLVRQPAFATLAYDEMEKLERMLMLTLDRVRAAKRAFRELPPDA